MDCTATISLWLLGLIGYFRNSEGGKKDKPGNWKNAQVGRFLFPLRNSLDDNPGKDYFTNIIPHGLREK